MRRSLVFAVLLAACAAGTALAKTITTAEAKAVFFGLDMGGVYEPDGAPWRECITPKGQTSYWFDGYTDIGRLTVRDNGVLCFSYESSDYKRQSCYTAAREGKGWRFVNVDDPTVVFLAKRATPTKTCNINAPSV